MLSSATSCLFYIVVMVVVEYIRKVLKLHRWQTNKRSGSIEDLAKIFIN